LHHEDGGSKERKEMMIIKDGCSQSDSIDCFSESVSDKTQDVKINGG
jgi:hypothetical protein